MNFKVAILLFSAVFFNIYSIEAPPVEVGLGAGYAVIQDPELSQELADGIKAGPSFNANALVFKQFSDMIILGFGSSFTSFERQTSADFTHIRNNDSYYDSPLPPDTTSFELELSYLTRKLTCDLQILFGTKGPILQPFIQAGFGALQWEMVFERFYSVPSDARDSKTILDGLGFGYHYGVGLKINLTEKLKVSILAQNIQSTLKEYDEFHTDYDYGVYQTTIKEEEDISFTNIAFFLAYRLH